MSIALATLAVAAIVQTPPTIESVLESDLRDASFVARVQDARQAELRKINADFANSYRFKSSKVWIKAPLKLRMESTVDDTKIFFIVDGPKRLVRIPRVNLSQREDLSRAPGKRQTPLDFGILTPALFDNFFQAKFVRTEARGERAGQHVFDLTYVPSLKDRSRHRVWVDPKIRFTSRREWYGQRGGGKLMAIFSYEQPKQFGEVWLPTRVSVTNADGKLAGSTVYSDIKVNSGVPDSLFEIR